ncbi:unnamed protein product [Euphydryas editha]|uniref:AB hydrolase-1 domain-containing protein n=1 Tax=Euphydryas editha TaxID=104508 RepID=A0AAU9UU48_EUPED|nr:unnamed protein product [Euphydryas editha]
MSLLEKEKEWFIQAPWGRLCIVAWGDCSDPPVLVCHGSADTIVSFRPLMALLPSNFYYIGLELPGCGKSDSMPPGLMLSVFDLVYSIQVVVNHFRWKNFVFLAHSLGCILGKLYDLSHPGKMSKCIDLDPITLAFTFPVEKFHLWYKFFYLNYFDSYEKYNMSKGKRPTYTEEMALSKLMKRRGINSEIAKEIASRLTEPAGNGLVRFSFDDRITITTHPPYTTEYVKKLLKTVKTPTLTFVADESKKTGEYDQMEYFFDESFSSNFKVKVVSGNHDVHVIHPERVSSFITQFLLYGLPGLDGKAKL